MKMFTKKWWRTKPRPSDSFGVHIRETYQSLRMLYGKLFIDRYYAHDGYPIRCEHCGSTDITSETEETIQGHVSQEMYKCSKCDYPLAFWAYGHFDPMYKEMAFKPFDG